MIYIILLFLISVAVGSVSTEQMFAGNGLTTYAYNVFNGETIEINCTTYDDCYFLLCSYLFQPMYIVTVKPDNWNQRFRYGSSQAASQSWNGSCLELDKDDNRRLAAELYTYNNNYPIGANTTHTVSDTSILLCMLNENKVITKIYYFVDDCDLSKSKVSIL